LSLDPGNITAIEGFDDHKGYVQCAVDAFSTVHSALQRLSDAREQVKKDTSKTEANQILVVATEAGKLQDAATRKFDAARKTLTDGIAHNDALLSKPLATAADNSISAEVRKYVRELSDDKRHAFLNDAMKRGDTSTLAAVLGAQPFLSGLTHEMQVHFTRALHEKQSPEIAARLQVMRRALELVESRSGLVFTEVEKALGARWDVVQKLRATQSSAEQALLLINSPVAP
jgi:DNA-binding phage protein